MTTNNPYQKKLTINEQEHTYYSLADAGISNVNKLPFSLKILLENQLRYFNSPQVSEDDIQAFSNWLDTKTSTHEIAYFPARVLMQDFTGVPSVVDLAAMRESMKKLGGDPSKINPLCPVDLVIDHSVTVDAFGDSGAFERNVSIEMQRNHERYIFLKWGREAFNQFEVVPPGTGICHQVNVEYLAKVVQDKDAVLYPDTLVGTDSHTTMVNALGVLGWGVGGIEAEAAMLGQPYSMLLPEVIGVKLTGETREGITATDIVLTITQRLRERGVVGKFVEYFGPGLKHLPLGDRATIANMAPEYGATCGIFPIDEMTLTYLKISNRDQAQIDKVKAYAQAQNMWHDENSEEATYTDVVEVNLSAIEASLAGPKRPQDRVNLLQLPQATKKYLEDNDKGNELDKGFDTAFDYQLHHGDIIIAAITSCTNTSNPRVMLAAGLIAKKAVALGLTSKPWVKTSLAPGSKVVSEYLEKAGLMDSLEKLGFYLVGFGCTTCIGNSGPLEPSIGEAITQNDICMSSVLSGNRNFEGRIHPLSQMNWLASPPLVVAYAIAGTTNINLETDPLSHDKDGKPIYLKDIWPSNDEIAEARELVNQSMFATEYADVFKGDAQWQAIEVTKNPTYNWAEESTYVRNPPFFDGMTLDIPEINDIKQANILALLGDSVTTDHISPAGSIPKDSPAGRYLQEHNVEPKDFNSYGSRRGNHEVLMRGTFANIRIRNEMLDDVEGGYTTHIPSDEQLAIYDAAMRYKETQTPLVVIAGKEYGTGSSRDWAAKGPALLGVKAVIAESFERIHRSNLIGMGVLPLEFKAGDNRKTLNLVGDEVVSIDGLTHDFKPAMDINVTIEYPNGESKNITVKSRVDTKTEAAYYKNGGILQYVIRKFCNNK